MNKNQKLFDQIAENLGYTKFDDKRYERPHGTKFLLTTRGFVSFGQWKVMYNENSQKSFSDFWDI